TGAISASTAKGTGLLSPNSFTTFSEYRSKSTKQEGMPVNLSCDEPTALRLVTWMCSVSNRTAVSGEKSLPTTTTSTGTALRPQWVLTSVMVGALEGKPSTLKSHESAP